jgi:hypothetical protein
MHKFVSRLVGKYKLNATSMFLITTPSKCIHVKKSLII